MEPQSGGFELETPDLSSALLKLAQLRHARGIELAQVASRREFSHQVHEDKVIAEFLAWNPPGNIRRMYLAENCEKRMEVRYGGKISSRCGVALMVLFAYFVWPTPYRYFVLPSVPPNAADPSDSGTPPQLVRMNRFTERVWVHHNGASWYSPEERADIAQRESQEIRKRCGDAEATGAFSDPQNRRIVELKGYAFPCQ